MKKILLIIFMALFPPQLFAASLPFSDDFNSYDSINDLTSSGEWFFVNSDYSLESEGCSSGKCIKVNYKDGGSHTATLKIPTAPPEIYAKFKFKVSSTPHGGIKFFKAFGNGYSEGNYANFTVNYGPVANEESYLTNYCFGNSDTGSNDTQICFVTSGDVGPKTYEEYTIVDGMAGDYYATPGEWHTVDIYGKHSTGTDSVNLDGEFKLKVDGVVYLHIKDFKNRGVLNERGFEKIVFGDYGNQFANMTIWFDDIQISDSPIPDLMSDSPIPDLESDSDNLNAPINFRTIDSSTN